MSPFTKLSAGILQSSIMAEPPEVFKVWVTLMAAADPDGIAPVSAQFLSTIARLPIETTRAALQRLEAPDPDSRSTNDDGRRIRRVDGGYLLINYARYRTRSLREAEAERKRLYRRANPSIAAAENYRRRHPPTSPSSDPDPEGEEEVEGEPSRVRPDGHGRTPDGQNRTPSPITGRDGLLPIPKGLPFDAKDELVKARADIRHLARRIGEGTNKDEKDLRRLESWRREFNERIRDLT